MAFLSVIIPTFNSGKVASQCLDSIIHQSCTDFEIIVIDGLSGDNTIEVVQSYASTDKRIAYISEKDNGIYDAMNKGIEKANGDWLLFLGSDDELVNNNVLENFAVSGINSADEFIYGDVITKGDSSWAADGTIYDGPFTTEKLFKRNICHQSVFYKRRIFEETGLFNTKYTVCADWDMNHRFFARGKTKYIPHIISRFYAGGESTRNNHDLFTDRDCVNNIRRYYKINFFNKLFRTYQSIFFDISRAALSEKAYLSSLRYFIIAWYHSAHKYNMLKVFVVLFAKRITGHT